MVSIIKPRGSLLQVAANLYAIGCQAGGCRTPFVQSSIILGAAYTGPVVLKLTRQVGAVSMVQAASNLLILQLTL